MDIKIEVFNQEQYDGEWPPETVLEFMEWFSSKIVEIPEEYQHTAKIELESVGGYEGDHYSSIEIYYYRPETAKEIEVRELDEKVKMDRIKQQELQLLEDLKRKYNR